MTWVLILLYANGNSVTMAAYPVQFRTEVACEYAAKQVITDLNPVTPFAYSCSSIQNYVMAKR